ncbi:MAG: hypothetical protein FJZ95_08110 [Chloroflexi bacterium]|nr:hypothetical protein [Chloroflexota bacterium]
MLTKYDEMMCHQIVSTFDHPVTSAREWTERIWFMAHDIKGELILVTGFGYYPNRNIMDAFMCLAVKGKTQHVIRASRELRPRIDEVSVGPFSWDVIEPMRKVAAKLAENEHGVSYDIRFDATMPPHDEEPPQFYRVRGRVIEDIRRYFQVGKPTGWIKVHGQTHTIDPKSWRTYRDHSWGIRRGAMEFQETGVQPGDIPTGFLYTGACWQFDAWGVNYHVREDWDSRVTNFSGAYFYPFALHKEGPCLASIDHQLTFRTDVPGVRQPNGGRVILNGADGSVKEVTIRPLGVIYIGTGGYSYANYRGFTHGRWMGSSWMDGFTLDITDPNVIREATYLDELACELSCGDEIGYGMTEMTVIGKYPKYGYQGW